MKRLYNIDISIVYLLTIFSVIFVLTPDLNKIFIRTILGLLLILFLPGYSLIALLFPKKDDLSIIERLILSFGLSVAISPLIALLLYYTQFEIKLDLILVSLSLFTFLMISGAYIRRLKITEKERFSIEI